MYSYGHPHMAKQKQDDQLEHTYSSYVRIQGVALKTCQRRWTIGRSGKRGSGISVPAARHDDDDDDIYRRHLRPPPFLEDIFIELMGLQLCLSRLTSMILCFDKLTPLWYMYLWVFWNNSFLTKFIDYIVTSVTLIILLFAFLHVTRH